MYTYLHIIFGMCYEIGNENFVSRFLDICLVNSLNLLFTDNSDPIIGIGVEVSA